MKRSTLLLAAAALLLAAGIGGPLLRSFRPPQVPVSPAAEGKQRLADELSALRKEFLRDSEQVLARMRDQLARGDSASAMALGARYRRVGDTELDALYKEAVDRERYRQRLAEVRDLMARQCQPLGARTAAIQFLRSYAVLAEGASVEKLILIRLQDTDVHSQIVDLITPQARVAKPSGDDPVSKARAVHRARLHPIDAVALQSNPPPAGIVCAWRLEGPIAASRQRIRLDFWLAPAPTAKSLDFEPLVYAATGSPAATPSKRQARSSAPVADTSPTKPAGP